MNKDKLTTMIEGKTPLEIAELAQIARNPGLQVCEGLDFTNVHVQTIPGAIRFHGFDSYEDSINPQKFSSWSVCFVNGPMRDLYRINESDLRKVEEQHGENAAKGIRNQSLLVLVDGKASVVER